MLFGNPVVVGAGPAGAAGAPVYLYQAWASDSSGTNFTTTFDASLDYTAFKISYSVLTPVVGDFAGLWKNYKGAQGIQGIQGIPGEITAALLHAAPSKTIPVNDDEIFILDSASSYILSKLTFANIKAALGSIGLYYNAIINPQFQINQRAVATYTSSTTPANSDDAYLLDQWVLLSDGNDIVDVSQEFTIVPPGAPSCLKLEIETANKKFGKIFFLENKDALKFAGKSVSLQFKARTTIGKAIRNIRSAVLSWSSTADTITSDVVDAWGAEGSNPTLVANWTAENVAANLALVADTWTTHKIENIAIDTASMANLAVFIWVDDADCAVDDLLYLADIQLNEGAVCLPFMPSDFQHEQIKCTRFLEKSYKETEPFGTTTGDSGIMFYNFGHETNSQRAFSVAFASRKALSTPTVLIYDRSGGGGSGANARVSTINAAGTAWTEGVAIMGCIATDKSFFIYMSGAIGGVGFHYVILSEL